MERSLQLTRVDGTKFTYDVEYNWRGDGWVWLGRIIFYGYATARIARGNFSAEEVTAIERRLSEPHGRVCTVQLKTDA